MTTRGERPATLNLAVAEEIRVELTRQRMSQIALARALGHNKMWVSDRMTGKQTIDLDDLERIAQVLKIDPLDLIRSAYEVVAPARPFSRERDVPGGRVSANHPVNPTRPRPPKPSKSIVSAAA